MRNLLPSYIDGPPDTKPWDMFLEQVSRAEPYLEKWTPWIDTLRRPRRALIVDLRTAAYVLACQRILEARRLRGLFP